MTDKLQNLLSRLAACDRIAVAFSGGVDSTFLLAAAVQARGREKVLALLGESPLRPQREIEKAHRLAARLGVALQPLPTRELELEEFLANPPERCYICKRHLLGLAAAAARQWHPATILVEGSNQDDLKEFRPGRKAVVELGVQSPLAELGFTKTEIRACSRQLGLSTWNQPAFSCLATRIPHASPITPTRLERIDKAETFLNEKGFSPVRVRDYQELCRLEISEHDLSRCLATGLRQELTQGLKKLGYRFITLDLEGFSSGSLNPGDRT
jgi:uncharacterized protein